MEQKQLVISIILAAIQSGAMKLDEGKVKNNVKIREAFRIASKINSQSIKDSKKGKEMQWPKKQN